MSDTATWKREPLDGGVSSGCLNCGGRGSVHPLDGTLGVGFGMCAVTKDDETVWFEGPDTEEYPTLQQFEDMARQDPEHDWTVSYDAPMWSGVWQRHGEDEWVLVERGEGFA